MKQEDKISLVTTLLFLTCIGIMFAVLAGCTVKIQHEYPMPPPDVHQWFEQMDYA